MPAKMLGYAGLLPQIIALVIVARGGPIGDLAALGGFAYAVIIFSFLGGVWWGQAITAGDGRAPVYVLAVMPSLIGLGAFLSWGSGDHAPANQLLCLAPLIALSPSIDRWLGYANKSFMQLRRHLSIGLGVLTFALGVLAQNAV